MHGINTASEVFQKLNRRPLNFCYLVNIHLVSHHILSLRVSQNARLVIFRSNDPD